MPIWGLDKYNISFGAPKLTNSCKTFLHKGLLIPVVNLPSEKVPAPPSPNWTLENGFKILLNKKLSTSFFLSSTVLPCSTIIGQIPFCIKINAENNPAGPAPIITGEIFLEISLLVKFLIIVVSILQSSIFGNLGYFDSSLTDISIV